MIKRLGILLPGLLIALAVSAEFRWGPTATMNISTYHFNQDLIKVDPSPGADVGVMGELMFPGIGFGIDFGLQYSAHGSKLHLGDYNVWSNDGFGVEQSYLHTIQIPVNLRFKYTNLYGWERTIAPFVYGGPVFEIIAGQTGVEQNGKKALETSNGCISLQCGLGAELWRHFQISAGYYWAMTYETRTVKLDNVSARSQGWNVKLTYLF